VLAPCLGWGNRSSDQAMRACASGSLAGTTESLCRRRMSLR
jgi:hypothetical protein